MQELQIFQNKFIKFLGLSYAAFDQKAKSGWRLIAENGKYDKAAAAILFYVQNKQGLDEAQIANLYFHAGQMFAFDNAYENAIVYFKKATFTNEPENALVRWNDYVFSTIAFLQKDTKALAYYRDEIAAKGIEIEGTIPNLSIVENMINNLELPYAEVYRMPSAIHPKAIST